MNNRPDTVFFRNKTFISCLKILSLGLLLIAGSALHAQKTTKIELVQANSLEFDKTLNKDVRRLLGDVILKQDNALMYCDSAYLYSESNKFDAFGKIHIHASDSVDIWGDILKYDGNTKLAELRYNCRMVDNQTTLTSDFLYYDLQRDIAYYNTGGYINSDENKLRSRIGRYHSKEKLFFFRDSVVLINPKYTITCDTLKYNTVTEISYFFGPTTIVSKENTIYCENGWYDSKKDISHFSKNAYLKNEKQCLRGDSLFYDRAKGYGNAKGHVSITDIKDELVICGNYGEYFENPEFTQVTGTPYLIKNMDGDSLYLHADTLYSVYDTLTEKRTLYAYKHVKFFKSDLQGICDSIIFFFTDSTINLYGNPVLWSDENQLSADFIKIITGDSAIKELQMFSASFIVAEEDTVSYNQIKGKDMVGYFENNALSIIDVTGNGQTVYYVQEDNGAKTGVNVSESSTLRIYLKENKVDKIYFRSKPVAILHPVNQIPEDKKKLKGFRWLKELRPKDKDDIFIWRTQNL